MRRYRKVHLLLHCCIQRVLTILRFSVRLSYRLLGAKLVYRKEKTDVTNFNSKR